MRLEIANGDGTKEEKEERRVLWWRNRVKRIGAGREATEATERCRTRKCCCFKYYIILYSYQDTRGDRTEKADM